MARKKKIEPEATETVEVPVVDTATAQGVRQRLIRSGERNFALVAHGTNEQLIAEGKRRGWL